MLRGVKEVPEAAEEAALAVLTTSPLDETTLPMAVALARVLRTQRLGLAIGRKFYELRKIAPTEVAQACLRIADKRLIPLLESRAFADEAEEVAWLVLALVHAVEDSDKLQKALDRTHGRTRWATRRL